MRIHLVVGAVSSFWRRSICASQRAYVVVIIVVDRAGHRARTDQYGDRVGRRPDDRGPPSAREDRQGCRRRRRADRLVRRRRRRLLGLLRGDHGRRQPRLRRGRDRRRRTWFSSASRWWASGPSSPRPTSAGDAAPGRRRFGPCGARLRRCDVDLAAGAEPRWWRCWRSSWPFWSARAGSRAGSTACRGFLGGVLGSGVQLCVCSLLVRRPACAIMAPI